MRSTIFKFSVVLGSLLSVWASSAHAGVIRSGTLLAGSPSECCSLTADLLFDQSGLSANYVSGVTDFNTYLASNPTATGSSTFPNFPGGYFAAEGATVDVDLGGSYTLERLAMWNDHDFQGVNAFRVLLGSDSSFTSTTLLGSFNAVYGIGNTTLAYDTGLPHQTFNLGGATGRYVRFVFDSSHGDDFININELAFETQSSNNVPEPAGLALVGLALAGVWVSRRAAR